MTKTATGQFDSSILAVLHLAGGEWRMLVADTRGARPRILESRGIPGDRIGRLDSLLDEHRAGRVICVLPASSVICRSCTLPDASDDQLYQALQLQAEAQLLGSAPPHRLAMAVLQSAPGETSRAGIILAWPESASFVPPETIRPITFAPDVAGLAALLNGQRPAEPLLWLDRKDGSIAAAIIHANGAAFRAAREDPSDDEAWRGSVTRTLAETAINVGHSDGYIDSLQGAVAPVLRALGPARASLTLDPLLRDSACDRLDGAAHDADWWSAYGIAAGVLLATTDQLQPLTQLKAEPPLERPSRILSAIHALSRPRAAAITVVICALLLALGPMAIAGLNLKLLQMMHPDLDERKAEVDEMANKLAMYRTLKDRAWSMTKLMSEIACNTPQGIELEWIRLTHGQPFAVQGTALPDKGSGVLATELVGTMQSDLRESGIFDDIKFSWSDRTSQDAYSFELSARVVKPHPHKKYDIRRDFALWTMQARVNNEPPPVQETTVAAGADEKTDDTPPDPRPSEGPEAAPGDTAVANAENPDAPSATDDGTGNGRSEPVSRIRTAGGASDLPNMGNVKDRIEKGPGSGPLEVPDPIEQSQLEAMSAEALYELVHKISAAQKHADLDDETRERLDREFKMVFAEYRKKKRQ